MFDRFKRLLGLGKKTSAPHATHSTSKGARHAVRKPKRSQPGRDTSAAFRLQAFADFMNGEEVRIFTSDWVDRAQWDQENEALTITFDDGHRQAFPCSYGEAVSFADAPSKGGWIWDAKLYLGEKGTPA